MTTDMAETNLDTAEHPNKTTSKPDKDDKAKDDKKKKKGGKKKGDDKD